MALVKQYEIPLQVSATAEVRARIKTISDRENLSQAQVVRELIDAGLSEREVQSLATLHPDVLRGRLS